MKLAILNTSIVTADGHYSVHTITAEQARELVADAVAGSGIDSAVGHEGTAEILSAILGVQVPVNRQQFEQQPGQHALVFKLNGRPEPGRELSRAELEEIGFTFRLLVRLDEESLWRAPDGRLWAGPVAPVQPAHGSMEPVALADTTLADAAAIAASRSQWTGDADDEEYWGAAPEPGVVAAYQVGRRVTDHHGVDDLAVGPITVDGVAAGDALAATLAQLAEVDRGLTHDPDALGDYQERNAWVVRAVALAIAARYAAGYRYDGDDPRYRLVAYVDLPGAGQVSWHLPTTAVEPMPAWPPYPSVWDGHSRDDKAARIAAWLAKRP